MRILIATPFYPPQVGVLATYAAGLEKAWKAQGHQVEVVTPHLILPLGIRHLEYFFRLFSKLRGVSFVLALDTWSTGVPASYAAKMRRVPCMVRVGGDFLWEQYLERTHEPIRLSEFYSQPRTFSTREKLIQYLTKRLLVSAHMVMFNTQFQKEIWDVAYHIPRSSVLENYYPQRKISNVPPSRIFVSAHRGAWYKNRALVDTAFAQVKAVHSDIELDAREVSHAEQLSRLSRSYAVIIPSISEVGSNLAIEAVSAGKPFIMTDDTGTKERLKGCGLFIDTRSEKAMIDAIESLLDPAVYTKFQATINAFPFTHAWDDMAKEVIAKL